MSGTNRDTLVSCGTCGSETYVNFQVCLQNGWPSHCGYTMRMVTTEADIDKAVAKTIGPKIRASLSDVLMAKERCTCEWVEDHRGDGDGAGCSVLRVDPACTIHGADGQAELNKRGEPVRPAPIPWSWATKTLPPHDVELFAADGQVIARWDGEALDETGQRQRIEEDFERIVRAINQQGESRVKGTVKGNYLRILEPDPLRDGAWRTIWEGHAKVATGGTAGPTPDDSSTVIWVTPESVVS